MTPLDETLNQLADLIRTGRFTDLETEVIEIKPVPATGAEWKEIHKSVDAFLNTRGGILVLGVKEETVEGKRRYVITGWKPHAEPNIKSLAGQFTDRDGVELNLTASFPHFEIREMLGERIALAYVDELPADQKYVFHDRRAYRRILTGDHRIEDGELERQEQFKEETANSKELQPVPALTVTDLDLARLNQFIFKLNQPFQVETLKSDLTEARSFLERRRFLIEGTVSVLGALVCASHPGESLGFRCHVHGYVDVADQAHDDSQIVRDKQDFVDNVLQLMELSQGYLLRNIQVGVAAQHGGTTQPQYPTELLRETVNNALAHRDYSIDRQVILSISPGMHICVKNPGAIRKSLLIESPDSPIPVRRILPEANPRNPKLADVLRIYRKWEGRGIGMATLVNLCLQNKIDLPYYRLQSQEVSLFLCSGKLLDEHMERVFHSFDEYIQAKLLGNPPDEEQKLVLSYLIKSEVANELLGYTILLTPDNNHYVALIGLEKAGLISKHESSRPNYPVYVVDRVLVTKQYLKELRATFGDGFDQLDALAKKILGVLYRHMRFSSNKLVSAKTAAFSIWYEAGRTSDGIEQFDVFYRKVRYVFNKLEKAEYIQKQPGSRGYSLNTDYLKTHIL